jgi:branched-chain amino acid aminotransferase
VFEGERAYGGTIYKGTEHSERLKRSANILDFEIPYSVAEIDAAKRLGLDRNNQKDAYVRPSPGAARSSLASRRSRTRFISPSRPGNGRAISTRRSGLKGIRLDLAEYRRPDPATARASPRPPAST